MGRAKNLKALPAGTEHALRRDPGRDQMLLGTPTRRRGLGSLSNSGR